MLGYISRGTRARKVSYSYSDLQGHQGRSPRSLEVIGINVIPQATHDWPLVVYCDYGSALYRFRDNLIYTGTIIKTTSVDDARLSVVGVAGWPMTLTGWPVGRWRWAWSKWAWLSGTGARIYTAHRGWLGVVTGMHGGVLGWKNLKSIWFQLLQWIWHLLRIKAWHISNNNCRPISLNKIDLQHR